MSASAPPFLAPRTVEAIHRLQLRGLATALALDPVSVTLYRRGNDGDADPQPLTTVTVARRWANRQPRATGTEAAASNLVAGDLRAYAPWDVAVGDTFLLDGQACTVVPPITTKDGITTAQFTLDQGAP